MNAKASNLQWGTRSENALDRLKHGNDKAAANAAKTLHLRQGERSSSAKFSNAEACEIRKRASDGETTAAISRAFPSASYWSVNNIVRGKTFKCIEPAQENGNE
jgi:hypothetical protein